MSAAPSPTTQPPPPRRLRFMDYLGIVFGIIGVVGFVLAWYWHAQSVQERAPAYHVSPARARIVDTSIPAPPQLQVFYKGKELNDNVSAAIVYFWNDGKLPIKSEDVLEPLRIELEPGCEILDARIVRVGRVVSDITMGTISSSAVNGTTKNVLPLSFRILEQNDGAVLQIIYTGKPDARVIVRGAVVGAGSPKEVFAQQRPPADSLLTSRFPSWVSVAAVAFTGALIALFSVWRKRKPPLFLIIVFGLQIAALATLMYSEHRLSQSVVPSSIWINQ